MNKKRIFPYDWSRMSVAEIEDNIKYLRKNYKKHKVVHKGNSIYIDNVCICWYAKTKPDVPFKIIYSSFDIDLALDINNRTFVASDGTVFQELQKLKEICVQYCRRQDFYKRNLEIIIIATFTSMLLSIGAGWYACKYFDKSGKDKKTKSATTAPITKPASQQLVFTDLVQQKTR